MHLKIFNEVIIMNKNIMIGGIVVLVILAVGFFVFMNPAQDATTSYDELKEIWGGYGITLEEQPLLISDALNSMSKTDFIQLKTKLMNFKNVQTDAEMKDLSDLHLQFIEFLIVSKDLGDIITKNTPIFGGDADIALFCTALSDLKNQETLMNRRVAVGQNLKDKIDDFALKYPSMANKLNLSGEKENILLLDSSDLDEFGLIVSEVESDCQ